MRPFQAMGVHVVCGGLWKASLFMGSFFMPSHHVIGVSYAGQLRGFEGDKKAQHWVFIHFIRLLMTPTWVEGPTHQKAVLPVSENWSGWRTDDIKK